ncbi:MAG: hypothetical protein KGJ23_02220 [Euryarchaeota archaeon]|nr:hypothetical protein [Euryarchaeota archaeon]MDE1835411.1 hypothetical protein [Euryarchaeota archaeon]MDE1879547.1 hypothetical protein [Euryarchaeota archaeon]MDE2046062.1 hypothetical protein [Thermoplasmata archaeon]
MPFIAGIQPSSERSRRAVPTRERSSSAPAAPAPGLKDELSNAEGLDQIFRVVRRAVRSVLGRERTGLGLAMSDLPPGLGAYWPVTGNLIVMNEGLLATMRTMASSPLEFNSFVYVILTHEYLHALGYWGEDAVRTVTARVTRESFGADHPATKMAEGDLWQRFPFLRFAPGGRGSRLRMVKGFDTDTTSAYIR